MSGQPCDWDGESYCTADICTLPATHRALVGMVDDLPLYEMVCCWHALDPDDAA